MKSVSYCYKNKIFIKIDKKYFNHWYDYLRGDYSKAKQLKFKPKYNVKDLIKEMLDEDIKIRA